MQENNFSSDDTSVSQLILELVKALVDDANSVTVRPECEEGVTILTVQVAPEDVGKVVGKQGRTARSLRTILTAAGMKLHKRYELDIRE